MTNEEKYDRAGEREERRAELDIKGDPERQAIVKAVNDKIILKAHENGQVKLSDRLQAERRFVEQRCGTDRICDKCWATLGTYADACVAELSEECPGFNRIEGLKEDFKRSVTPSDLAVLLGEVLAKEEGGGR